MDYNGNNAWDNGIDRSYTFGKARDIPFMGGWKGDGQLKIGVFRNGQFIVDYNGNHAWDNGIDRAYTFGKAGDYPVMGQWTSSASSMSDPFSENFNVPEEKVIGFKDPVNQPDVNDSATKAVNTTKNGMNPPARGRYMKCDPLSSYFFRMKMPFRYNPNLFRISILSILRRQLKGITKSNNNRPIIITLCHYIHRYLQGMPPLTRCFYNNPGSGQTWSAIPKDELIDYSLNSY